ncbi:MAG: histidinol dehydrogenase, partial [Eubacterium sp.]
MKTYTYTEAAPSLNRLLKRDEGENTEIRDTVLAIIDEVKARGDIALLDYTEKFDGCRLDSLAVTPEEIEEAFTAVGPEMIAIMEEAAQNIRSFHEKQLETTWTYSPGPGITLGQHITALERVGLYVPGGKAAYPSTVLMDSIPAIVAGVDSLVMVTPPGADGKINPNILAAAKIAGVTEILKVGGAQAIAALAFGTESVKPVNKIVGPGNIFVATAKKEVFGVVDIDMIAGPSEVLILADGNANPVFAAADLLSQAEHDEMAMPILVTTSRAFGEAVEAEITRQIDADLSRKAIARKSVSGYGFIFVCENLDQAFELSNAIAPEHMEILLTDAMDYLNRVRNA